MDLTELHRLYGELMVQYEIIGNRIQEVKRRIDEAMRSSQVGIARPATPPQESDVHPRPTMAKRQAQTAEVHQATMEKKAAKEKLSEPL